MYKKLVICLLLLYNYSIQAQENKNAQHSKWQAILHRSDSNQVIFNFQLENSKGKPVVTILNGSEKIKVTNVRFYNDSVFIQMPVFESIIKAKTTGTHWQGYWYKGSATKEQIIPFSATAHKNRFELTNVKAKINISGRWAVHFATDSSVPYPSVAEFIQIDNRLTGTFLNPTGDFRYLEGIVTGNQLRLSTFDGGHAFLFTATIKDNKTITGGLFYSGAHYKENWNAVRNKNATVNDAAVTMKMKPGETQLNFRFPDLNGDTVSINDSRFKNKVVIVQLMGSWCPNCMDETAFLSDYYKKNKQRGLEIISLAYEYSANFERSVKSLRKFQQRFNVSYPMLITGVTVSDSLRTEKTIPQITPVRFFPSSIIIDKKGIVRKFDTEFVGPGTGIHFENYTKNFYRIIDALLKEE